MQTSDVGSVAQSIGSHGSQLHVGTPLRSSHVHTGSPFAHVYGSSGFSPHLAAFPTSQPASTNAQTLHSHANNDDNCMGAASATSVPARAGPRGHLSLAKHRRFLDDESVTTLQRRYFTSTQMLGIVGSTRKTLRVLEERGLIRPARASGRRRYTQECLRRFWLIELLREAGLSLSRIGEILATTDGSQTGGEAATALLSSVGDLQRRIDGKIKGLELARDALTTASRTLTTHCVSCVKPPSACGECATNGRLDVVSALLLTNAGNVTDGTAGDS